MSRLGVPVSTATSLSPKFPQDFFHENLVIASPRAVERDDTHTLVPWRVYIIDFEYARLLEHGPGCQGAVELPNTIWPRPREGASHFDPYAWDMLCVGRAFEVMLRVSCPSSCLQQAQH